MVLGDHGRKLLVPLTLTQQFAHFPWGKYYRNSMYFRAWCGTALGLSAVWAYILATGNLRSNLLCIFFKFLLGYFNNYFNNTINRKRRFIYSI